MLPWNPRSLSRRGIFSKRARAATWWSCTSTQIRKGSWKSRKPCLSCGGKRARRSVCSSASHLPHGELAGFKQAALPIAPRRTLRGSQQVSVENDASFRHGQRPVILHDSTPVFTAARTLCASVLDPIRLGTAPVHRRLRGGLGPRQEFRPFIGDEILHEHAGEIYNETKNRPLYVLQRYVAFDDGDPTMSRSAVVGTK
jgi:hypothetical protein